MVWTEISRPYHERRCARYASDLTDTELLRLAGKMTIRTIATALAIALGSAFPFLQNR
jgi:hypothetical protein